MVVYESTSLRMEDKKKSYSSAKGTRKDIWQRHFERRRNRQGILFSGERSSRRVHGNLCRRSPTTAHDKKNFDIRGRDPPAQSQSWGGTIDRPCKGVWATSKQNEIRPSDAGAGLPLSLGIQLASTHKVPSESRLKGKRENEDENLRIIKLRRSLRRIRLGTRLCRYRDRD